MQKSKNKIIRSTLAYKLWRIEVFKRDDFTCQKCNKRGGGITAHHIKLFCEYENLRFEVDNGMTLCRRCHINEHRGER
jgi:5-methylcytosine-specific restriction endonuclease McrA